MGERAEFGLFPLAAVLVPGEILPLHIFEERYKRLFADLDGGREFGLVFVEEEGLHEIGCSARLAEVVDHLEGGRLNVLVQGVRRFRLLEVDAPDDLEAEYIRGVVQYVDDDEAEAPPELTGRALEAYLGMLAFMGAEAPPEPEGEGPLSYRMAAAVDFGAPFKQELLETLGEPRRLELLLEAIAALMPRLELRAKRQEAIRGNGKGY